MKNDSPVPDKDQLIEILTAGDLKFAGLIFCAQKPSGPIERLEFSFDNQVPSWLPKAEGFFSSLHITLAGSTFNRRPTKLSIDSNEFDDFARFCLVEHGAIAIATSRHLVGEKGMVGIIDPAWLPAAQDHNRQTAEECARAFNGDRFAIHRAEGSAFRDALINMESAADFMKRLSASDMSTVFAQAQRKLPNFRI